MKKLLVMIMAAILVFALVACTPESDDAPSSTDITPSQPATQPSEDTTQDEPDTNTQPSEDTQAPDDAQPTNTGDTEGGTPSDAAGDDAGTPVE